MKKKLIGYVSGKDFPLLIEKDIKALDVINIAFGIIENGRVVYKPTADFEKELQRVRNVHPQCKLVLSVGGWTAVGFSEADAHCLHKRLLPYWSATIWTVSI